jgi:hypothetical protein
MKCVNCKFDFCWICREKYYDGHIRDKHSRPPPQQSIVHQVPTQIQYLPIPVPQPMRRIVPPPLTIVPKPPIMEVPALNGKRKIEIDLTVSVKKKIKS